MPARNDIVDYEVTAEAAAIDPALGSEGDNLPMLVVNVDDDETVSGHVFLTDGSTRYVHVPKVEPEPEPVPAPTLAEQFGSLSDDERAAFLASHSAPTAQDPAGTPTITATPEGE